MALEPHGSEERDENKMGSEAGGQRKVVEARLNVMQAVFLAIQTSPSLGRDILEKGQHIFHALFNKYFTETLEVYLATYHGLLLVCVLVVLVSMQ